MSVSGLPTKEEEQEAITPPYYVVGVATPPLPPRTIRVKEWGDVQRAMNKFSDMGYRNFSVRWLEE